MVLKELEHKQALPLWERMEQLGAPLIEITEKEKLKPPKVPAVKETPQTKELTIHFVNSVSKSAQLIAKESDIGYTFGTGEKSTPFSISTAETEQNAVFILDNSRSQTYLDTTPAEIRQNKLDVAAKRQDALKSLVDAIGKDTIVPYAIVGNVQVYAGKLGDIAYEKVWGKSNWIASTTAAKDGDLIKDRDGNIYKVENEKVYQIKAADESMYDAENHKFIQGVEPLSGTATYSNLLSLTGMLYKEGVDMQGSTPLYTTFDHVHDVLMAGKTGYAIFGIGDWNYSTPDIADQISRFGDTQEYTSATEVQEGQRLIAKFKQEGAKVYLLCYGPNEDFGLLGKIAAETNGVAMKGGYEEIVSYLENALPEFQSNLYNIYHNVTLNSVTSSSYATTVSQVDVIVNDPKTITLGSDAAITVDSPLSNVQGTVKTISHYKKLNVPTGGPFIFATDGSISTEKTTQKIRNESQIALNEHSGSKVYLSTMMGMGIPFTIPSENELSTYNKEMEAWDKKYGEAKVKSLAYIQSIQNKIAADMDATSLVSDGQAKTNLKNALPGLTTDEQTAVTYWAEMCLQGKLDKWQEQVGAGTVKPLPAQYKIQEFADAVARACSVENFAKQDCYVKPEDIGSIPPKVFNNYLKEVADAKIPIYSKLADQDDFFATVNSMLNKKMAGSYFIFTDLGDIAAGSVAEKSFDDFVVNHPDWMKELKDNKQTITVFQYERPKNYGEVPTQTTNFMEKGKEAGVISVVMLDKDADPYAMMKNDISPTAIPQTLSYIELTNKNDGSLICRYIVPSDVSKITITQSQ